MAHAQHKDCTINLRAHSSQKDLIDRAAKMLHKNRSDFILEAAYREAENTLLDKRLFFANDSDFERFNDLLGSTVKDNEKLTNLLGSKSPWES